MSDPLSPFHLFQFNVEFRRQQENEVQIAFGAFSECTGLEATMEPKVVKEGGVNYGATQLAGRVTFATVILKRGVTTNRDLWKWFSHVNEKGKYAYRLDVRITVTPRGEASPPDLVFTLSRALPIKFKFGDLNAKATEVGIEELHLAHEGLSIE
jgi:phage tail-like protein